MRRLCPFARAFLVIVTILYADGSSEQFTNVTSYTNDGDVVTIIGVDAAGVSGTFQINWSLIRKVTQQGK
jgi:hypothetical protein